MQFVLVCHFDVRHTVTKKVVHKYRHIEMNRIHQHALKVELHTNILIPFVSIGLLSERSVLGSQWEYKIECSFLHLDSLAVFSVSVTFVALPYEVDTTHCRAVCCTLTPNKDVYLEGFLHKAI